MKMIVIDDDLISRKKLAEILKQFGEISDFERGDIAILYYEKCIHEKKSIDLITIDISMPVLNGLAVLAKMRDVEKDCGLSEEKKAHIVMVTSSDDKEKVLDALKAGCDDYILKPFDEESVLSRLKIRGILPQ